MWKLGFTWSGEKPHDGVWVDGSMRVADPSVERGPAKVAITDVKLAEWVPRIARAGADIAPLTDNVRQLCQAALK
jgi:hypothetical protein